MRVRSGQTRKIDPKVAQKRAEALCSHLDMLERLAPIRLRWAAWLIAGNEIRRAAKR